MTELMFLRFSALLTVALLTPAIVFIAFWIANPEAKHWRYLAGSAVAMFCAALFAASRVFVPGIIPTLISNLMFGVGYFLLLTTLQSIRSGLAQQRLDFLWLFGYAAIVLAIHLWANTYENRVLVVSTGIFVISSVLLWRAYVFRETLNRLGRNVLSLALLVNIAIAGSRGLAAATGEFLFRSLAFWDQVFFLGTIFTVFAISSGFFLIGSAIANERTTHLLRQQCALTDQLKVALEDKQNLQTLLLHEIKRPINAMSAALQLGPLQTPEALMMAYPKLVRLVGETASYLERIGEYEDMSDLFESPNCIDLDVGAIARDLKSKWRVEVRLADHLQSRTIHGDPLLLDIALGNIVENGQKFGRDPAKVCLYILDDDTHYHFDVEDDGPGIPANEHGKVGQKFYRVGRVSANMYTGCGLGLHAAKRAAEAHGGYVRVLSQSPSRIRFAVSKSGRGGRA
jgi:signal transduction histidine kinase